MNEKEEILNALTAIKNDIIKEISYLNGKHDALMNDVAKINSIIISYSEFEEKDDD